MSSDDRAVPALVTNRFMIRIAGERVRIAFAEEVSGDDGVSLTAHSAVMVSRQDALELSLVLARLLVPGASESAGEAEKETTDA